MKRLLLSMVSSCMLIDAIQDTFQSHINGHLSWNEQGIYQFRNEEDLQSFFKILNKITPRDIEDDAINQDNDAIFAAIHTCHRMFIFLSEGLDKESTERFLDPCRELYKNTAIAYKKLGHDYKKGEDSIEFAMQRKRFLTDAVRLEKEIIPAWNRVEEKLKNS